MEILKSTRIAVAVALLVLANSEPSIAQQNAPKPAVTTVPAKLEAVANSATFTGRVEAALAVEMRARVSGFIEKIGFEEGRNVNQGDVLFSIEPDAYEAEITRIKGQIKSAESEKLLADIEVDRQRELLASETVAENVVQQAEAKQGNAVGKLLELQGSLREAELNLSYTKVVAPFAGRLGFTDFDVGAFVGPDSGPLIELFSIDPIYVTFPVSEAEMLDWRERNQKRGPGGPVTVKVTLANGSEYAEIGKPDVTDVSVQEGTDTIDVRAIFPNPKGDLLDGQLVEVTLNKDNQEKSITIPAQALQRDQSGYFVMIVVDSKVERRGIIVERDFGTKVVVSKGLNEGDQVIMEGIQRARPGIEVNAEIRQQPASTSTGN